MTTEMTGPDTATEPGTRLRSVAVVGTGLIGTSVGLALRRAGMPVSLADADPQAVRIAEARGAGTRYRPGRPVDLTVIAVPPREVGNALRWALDRGLSLYYTDVASSKGTVHEQVAATGCDLRMYVGSHPMAGREVSGPAAGQPNLFQGRPWVVTPSDHTGPGVIRVVRDLIELCGATPVLMEAEAHDRSMALVSHTPHLLSTLLAIRLRDASETASAVSGRGLSDSLRLAGGAPVLWADILASNAASIVEVVEELERDLAAVVTCLQRLAANEAGAHQARAVLEHLLTRGQEGYEKWTAHRPKAPDQT